MRVERGPNKEEIEGVRSGTGLSGLTYQKLHYFETPSIETQAAPSLFVSSSLKYSFLFFSLSRKVESCKNLKI